MDTLFVYRLDAAQGRLIEHARVRTAPGAGPRHAAFHPTQPYVYVINELDSTVASYRYDRAEGTLAPAHAASTLPDGFDPAKTTCADIHVDRTGSFVYGSNRGHDSIAVFRVLDEGQLEPLGHVATGGRTPRNFTLVPGAPFLLAANQDSDSIVIFGLSAETGMPQPNGQRIDVAKPVCLRVLPTRP
ncbi:lactonase family protein [Gordoniibacillus kamchatkensis]|uniref:lactonase family protein n=1 Tax=Gordoniibacillus kamchatkensis TaxID=1590651 RepID=UPI000695E2E2|nr:beta-propeller fold lactonase family protein [Paenibacillus sp. VKM B-2647]